METIKLNLKEYMRAIILFLWRWFSYWLLSFFVASYFLPFLKIPPFTLKIGLIYLCLLKMIPLQWVWLIPRFLLSSMILKTRVDIHKPKLLILQFHTPNVRKNASHAIFIQFQNIIKKIFELVSAAVWTKSNSLVIEKKTFFLKRLLFNFN